MSKVVIVSEDENVDEEPMLAGAADVENNDTESTPAEHKDEGNYIDIDKNDSLEKAAQASDKTDIKEVLEHIRLNREVEVTATLVVS